MSINKLRTEFSTEVSCPLFPRCPGCKCLQGLPRPEIWKAISSFLLSLNKNIDPQLRSLETLFWRSRVKLAVRGKKGAVQIGLFEEGSHKVVDMESCPMQVDSINQALRVLREKIHDLEIEPYIEEKHQGRLKTIQMVANRASGLVQLTLVFHEKETLRKEELLFVKRLYKDHPTLWHSIWVNFLPEKTNTLLGSSWKLFYGEEDFWQKIGHVSFCFHPSCFAQAHLSLFEDLLHYIDSLFLEGSSLLELYCGVGCIGVHLARRASKVCLVESSPHAKACFEKTRKNLSKEDQCRCVFISDRVEQLASLFSSFEVVIVDPPRKGLSRECKALLCASNAHTLIYVSCGWESFQRDALELIEQGWRVDRAKGFVLFPATNHVEIVARFVR